MRALVVVLVSACSSTHGTGAGSGSVGSGLGSARPAGNARTCDDIRPRVEQLYREEAQVKQAKRVEEAVADNTTMVMNDCAKAPTTVVPCVASASSVVELEKQCLIPLDDEGTDGQAAVK